MAMQFSLITFKLFNQVTVNFSNIQLVRWIRIHWGNSLSWSEGREHTGSTIHIINIILFYLHCAQPVVGSTENGQGCMGL